MILVIDIGNSNIVVGLMDEQKNLIFSGRIRTSRRKTVSEFVYELGNLMKIQNASFDDVDGAIISSVVPQITDIVREGVERLVKKEPMILGQGMKTGIMVATDRPASVGTDLIADAVAGVEEYGGPLLIFDLGTATTCSVVDENKTYLGTLIIPGVRISSDALSTSASQLPNIRLEKPKNLIGKNTTESMQSGLLYGNACMIDGLIDRIEAEIGKKTTVIATGGISCPIVSLCNHEIIYDKDLILKGLWHIYQKNI